jgi:hypothetical protein
MDSVERNRVHRICAVAAGLVLSLVGTTVPAQGLSDVAPDRIIFVNGQLLDEEGLSLVDQLNCGEPVPDGNYWLDLENRLWGHVGVAGQNPLPDCSAGEDEAAAQQPDEEPAEEGDCESKYRFSEDRMCYCYGVC